MTGLHRIDYLYPMSNNDPYKGMSPDLRKVARAGIKKGWTWRLNKSMHYEVLTPQGVMVTTVAPRNAHWRKTFQRTIKKHGYPTK